MASKKHQRHFNSVTAYLSCFQIARHFEFDPSESTLTEKYTQGRLPNIAHPRVETNKKL